MEECFFFFLPFGPAQTKGAIHTRTQGWEMSREGKRRVKSRVFIFGRGGEGQGERKTNILKRSHFCQKKRGCAGNFPPPLQRKMCSHLWQCKFLVPQKKPLLDNCSVFLLFTTCKRSSAPTNLLQAAYFFFSASFFAQRNWLFLSVSFFRLEKGSTSFAQQKKRLQSPFFLGQTVLLCVRVA